MQMSSDPLANTMYVLIAQYHVAVSLTIHVRHQQALWRSKRHFLFYIIANAYTLGYLPLYYSRMRYVAPYVVELGRVGAANQYQDLESLAGYYQWPDILSELKRQWAIVSTSCALITS